MEDQPVPRDDRWPWTTAIWTLRFHRAKAFVSVRVERSPPAPADKSVVLHMSKQGVEGSG
jgi:hypothetical protein